MLIEQESRLNGAGWMPTRPSTTEEVMRVLEGTAVEDGAHRNACQWSLILFDYPDFVADMPIDAKRQLFELIANNKGTRYEAIRNYVVDAIDAILEEDL